MSESHVDRSAGSHNANIYSRIKVNTAARQPAQMPRRYVSDLNFNGRDPKAPVQWSQTPVQAVEPTPKQVAIVTPVVVAPAPVAPVVQPVVIVPQPTRPTAAITPIVTPPAPVERAVAAKPAPEPAHEPVQTAAQEPAQPSVVDQAFDLENIETVVSQPKVRVVPKSVWALRLERVRMLAERIDPKDIKKLKHVAKSAKVKKATSAMVESAAKAGAIAKATKAAKVAKVAKAVELAKVESEAVEPVAIAETAKKQSVSFVIKVPAWFGRIGLVQRLATSAAAAVVLATGAVVGAHVLSSDQQTDLSSAHVAALAEPKPATDAPVAAATAATANATAADTPAAAVPNAPVDVIATKRPVITKPTIDDVNKYTVNPDSPRYLKIPAIGVNVRVGQVGLENDGQLGAPSNLYDAAWYTASAKPGPPGAVLINGYANSGDTPGAFHDLGKLLSGDTLQVERGDGAVMTYKVVRIENIVAGKLDLRAAISPVMAGRPGLNLVATSDNANGGCMVVYAQQVQ